MPRLCYKNSGVDIDAGEALVRKIKPLAKSTKIPGVLGEVGGFGALFELPKNYQNPVLVAATDGVGTKLKIAGMLENHQTIGIDLVAMCANDLIVQGAKPLFFLDYFAAGKLKIEHAETIISGIAAGCRQAGCALIGGESAEMPGIYQNDDYDLAGFCVGVVEKSKIIDGKKTKPGDAIIALSSSGLHANGYTLVRAILARQKPGEKMLRALLLPTKIYVKTILKLCEKINIHAIANITGGGLLDNIPRVLPDNLAAKIDQKSWRMPEVFRWIQNSGRIETSEMHRVFNCGVGMVVIVSKNEAEKTCRLLRDLGERAWVIGSVVEAGGGGRVDIS